MNIVKIGIFAGAALVVLGGGGTGAYLYLRARPAAEAVTGCGAAVSPTQRSASCTNGSAAPAGFTSGRAGPTRSAGRCAVPNGSETVNVVPPPTVLLTRMAPP